MNSGNCWITHRKFDDFCATTPISLANGLIELGFNLTIMNPESDGSHAEFTWEHLGLETNCSTWFSEPFFFEEGARPSRIDRIGL